MDDGVRWAAVDGELVAREIAPESPAERAGIQPGDLLQQINGKPVESVDQIVDALHAARSGDSLTYSVLRLRAQQIVTVPLDLMPSGARGLYYVLAAVGIFTLLVGAGVRLRRPENQATLHFFWLSVAFFGVLAFSFSGQIGRASCRER